MSDATRKQGEGAVSRRSFIRKAGAAAASAAAVQQVAKADVYKSILPGSVLGANERIRTGHIGVGGMGRSDLMFCLQRNDIQPIALCDLYPKQIARAGAILKQKFPEFDTYHDFRHLLDNKDVDAVVIATPDHWHCLATLYAADAGKDIYCEKPLSTTIAEGQAMCAAVRRNNVVFQGGTMQRSGQQFKDAVDLVRSGHIGKVARVETWIHDKEDLNGIGMGEDDIRQYPGCDWTFHQGWTEHHPFNTNRWIYNFRWFLEYSGGKITDWGAHLIDIAIWAMGEEKQPQSVVAKGGKYLLQDNRTTPDTLEVLWQYDDYVLSFSNRVYNPYLPEGHRGHGILFHGTLGSLIVDRGGYRVIPSPINGGCEEKEGGPAPMNEPHWEDFVQCVRSRKDPICNVETLYNTTRTCHMATCSYVAGGELKWDPETEEFTGAGAEVRAANDWAYRKYLNGWSLEAPYWRG